VAWPLLAGIAGLALLDSLNPATIAAVALVLLLAQHRPVLSAVAVAAGAYLTVLGVGLVLFFSAGAVADAVNGVVVGLRFVAFGAAGISLIATGVRRLSDRPRKRIHLPDWFSPATAIGLGAGMTAADLPNAFPYGNLHRHWHSVPAARTCRSGWAIDLGHRRLCGSAGDPRLLRPSGG
jgi:hypothetical protein